MLRRLKRPRGARDLPGGGGEVKELRAVVSQNLFAGCAQAATCFFEQRNACRDGSESSVQLCARWQRCNNNTVNPRWSARMAMKVEHRRQ